MKTAEQVLSGTNKAAENIQAVEKQLFDVVKMKMRSPKTGFRAPQGNFGIWKSTGGECLGVVGKGTVPTQPRFLLNTVLNTAYMAPEMFDLSTLKFTERNDGSRIEFSINIGDFEVPTKLKKGDVTKMELLFSTTYNNEQSNRCDLNTTRCFCDNGCVRKFKTSSLKIKNTKSSETTIEKYFYDVAKILQEVDEYKEDMLKLAATKVNDKDIDRVICKVFEMNPKEEERKTRATNKYESIMKSINIEIERTGKTAYGLLQGITYHTNHVMGMGKDDDYIVTGNGAWMNEQAQKALLKMIN